MFWNVFYNCLVVPFLWILFRSLALIDAKATRAIRGRHNLFDKLDKDLSRLTTGKKRVWFHSSSMGEFEQAKPIIAELKRRQPEVQIIVSFFSPSGYEHSQNYALADIITYIPFDSLKNARRFVSIIHPSAAVIVRYDIWPNHLQILHQEGIPTFIANATLRRSAWRNLPLIKQFHRHLYNMLEYILTVSHGDYEAFFSYDLIRPTLEVIGDTRYDQVWHRAAESRKRQVIDPRILGSKKVLVVGSSWREDEEQLIPACHTLLEEGVPLLIILVPHEPTVENLERVEYELAGKISSIRFSNLHDYSNENLILIDSVGILMALYQYGNVAYVGGSFKTGIHNVLEPAAYGIPVLFGPEHNNSQEAVTLVQSGAAFVGKTANEIYMHLKRLLGHNAEAIEAGKKASDHVCSHTGATERFLSYLEKVL